MQMGTLDTSEWYTLQKQLYKDILTWEYAEETRAQILLHKLKSCISGN